MYAQLDEESHGRNDSLDDCGSGKPGDGGSYAWNVHWLQSRKRRKVDSGRRIVFVCGKDGRNCWMKTETPRWVEKLFLKEEEMDFQAFG